MRAYMIKRDDDRYYDELEGGFAKMSRGTLYSSKADAKKHWLVKDNKNIHVVAVEIVDKGKV